MDCYVITEQHLGTGDIIGCDSVAVLEQHEDGHEDHNILAVPVGEAAALPVGAESNLQDFIAHVFDHVPGKVISIGRPRGRSAAVDLVTRCTD